MILSFESLYGYIMIKGLDITPWIHYDLGSQCMDTL